MISIILFDVDGVLIRPTEYYSRILSRKGFIEAPTQIDAFYKTDMPCTVGKEDPLIRIREYLDNMLWEKSAQEYFDEQFAFEKQFVDNELLDGISRLRSSGIQCYLATDQNHYRKKIPTRGFSFRKKVRRMVRICRSRLQKNQQRILAKC
jgi:FMN phosphatase YigB (HAD superfamily)